MGVILTRLALDHFRSWQHCVVDLDPGVTVIQGANGQGKTNLVEAIEVLSTGSSHRVSSSMPLIERGQEAATIRVNVTDTGVGRPGIPEYPANLGAHSESESAADQDNSGNLNPIQDLPECDGGEARKHPDAATATTIEVTIRAHGANRARIDSGRSLYLRDILGRVPSMSFTPEDQRLISGDPAARRGFINQAGAMLVPGYAEVHQRCAKIARQRAALLKQIGKTTADSGTMGGPNLSGLEIWTGQFIEAGVELTRMRARILKALAGPFASIYDELAGSAQHAAIAYVPSFEEVLAEDQPNQAISRHFQRIYPGEVARGQNLIGPHRDDMAVTLDGVPAKEFASNGEMWTMALALKMALFGVIRQTTGTAPIVILDDVFAQLDETRRRQILDFAVRQNQVLITAAAAGDVPDVSAYGKDARIIDVAALRSQSDRERADRLLDDDAIARIKAARLRNDPETRSASGGVDEVPNAGTSSADALSAGTPAAGVPA
ncbi:DNA replication and repair protein RecF [Bifidobacterium thermophilum]